MNPSLEPSNKSFYKVNEVCEKTGVKSYVLRFWESEFEEITPMISASGQRLYEQKDIDLILAIKKMLFDDKMAVEKAKMELRKLKESQSTPAETKELEQKKMAGGKELTRLKLQELVDQLQLIKKRNNWS